MLCYAMTCYDFTGAARGIILRLNGVVQESTGQRVAMQEACRTGHGALWPSIGKRRIRDCAQDGCKVQASLGQAVYRTDKTRIRMHKSSNGFTYALLACFDHARREGK